MASKKAPEDWEAYFQKIETDIANGGKVIDKKNIALRMATFLLHIQPDSEVVARGLKILDCVLVLYN